ncbi:hypothetical protein ACVWWG_005276 [Bradyrhizobium sp. LB7.2]
MKLIPAASNNGQAPDGHCEQRDVAAVLQQRRDSIVVDFMGRRAREEFESSVTQVEDRDNLRGRMDQLKFADQIRALRHRTGICRRAILFTDKRRQRHLGAWAACRMVSSNPKL